MPECLARELREELGIEVAVDDLIAEIIHHYPGKSVDLKFFRCRLLSGEPAPIFCDAIAWVTPSQLDDYQFPAADAQLLTQLKSSPHIWK